MDLDSLGAAVGKPSAGPFGEMGYLGATVQMLAYLALVCLVMWVGLRWFLPRMTGMRFGSRRGMLLVDQHPLGHGRSVAILRVLGRYYLIGVSDGGVRLMKELDESDVGASYPQAAPAPAGEAPGGWKDFVLARGRAKKGGDAS